MAINFSKSGVISRTFWQDVFDAARLRKHPAHWGTVYDSRTKQPVDPAVVELLDALSGEVRQTAITDIWGKYGFLAERGDYFLRVKRSHYLFPSRIITAAADGIYRGVYRGEQISVREKWELVSVNIPLDPAGADYNQQAKASFASIHPRRENILKWLFNLVFGAGLAFAVWYFFQDHGLAQTAVLSLFVLLLGLRLLLPPRPLWGRLFSGRSGEPLGFVDLDLFMSMPNGEVLIARTRSVPGGKFFLKARPGKFILKITDPFSKQILAEGQVHLGSDGLLSGDIYI